VIIFIRTTDLTWSNSLIESILEMGLDPSLLLTRSK